MWADGPVRVGAVEDELDEGEVVGHDVGRERGRGVDLGHGGGQWSVSGWKGSREWAFPTK